MSKVRNLLKIIYFIYILLLIAMYTKVPDGNWDQYKDISTNLFIRNLDHLIIFFILGAISMFVSYDIDIFDKYVVSAFVFSSLIEFLHLILNYRGFQYIDLLYNITGCLLGIISLYYIRKLWKNF